MSITRSRPPISDSGPGQGKGVERFKRHISEEGRQRLSELAKERHRNGGFQKSRDGRRRGKKRKPSRRRVAQLVAEAAREKRNAQAIIDVFKDGTAAHQPMQIRLKAAEAWLRVEHEDAKLQLREADSESQKRDRDELLTALAKGLTSGHAGLLLRKQLEEQAGIVDAEVVFEDESHDCD